MLKETLYKNIPQLFQIALRVAYLDRDNKMQELNGVLWTLKMAFGLSDSETDILKALREIRMETMMDDGWIDYRQRSPISN